MAHPSAFAEYFVDADALGPVSGLIDTTMKSLAADYGRVWVGVNSPKVLTDGELTVSIVDADRMTRVACRSSASVECRAARSGQKNCAAVDSSTVICDVQFLFAVLALAAHEAKEEIFANRPDKNDRAQERFEDSFADSFSPDVSAQLARAKVLGRRFESESAPHRATFDLFLTSAVSFTFAHEYGHIALKHLHAPQFGFTQPNPGSSIEGTRPTADDEAGADQFALQWIARKLSLPVLSHIPLVLMDLETYWIHAAGVSAGIKDGRLLYLVPDDKQGLAFADALLRAGICDKSHPSMSARTIAITRSSVFAPALSLGPQYDLSDLSSRSEQTSMACRLAEPVTRVTARDEAVDRLIVAVRDPGAAPRTRLRYRWALGTEQKIAIDIHGEIHRYINGSPAPSSKVENNTTVAMMVTAVKRSYFNVTVKPLESSNPDLQNPVLMITLYDNRGAVWGSPRVETKESPTGEWFEDKLLEPSFAKFSQLHPEVAIFPEDEIGIGGSWSLSDRDEFGFKETIWTLVKREGNLLTLRGTRRLTLGPDHQGREGTVTFAALIDLTRPSPICFTQRLDTATTFTKDKDTIRETETSEIAEMENWPLSQCRTQS